jgi:hypothetical protein
VTECDDSHPTVVRIGEVNFTVINKVMHFIRQKSSEASRLEDNLYKMSEMVYFRDDFFGLIARRPVENGAIDKASVM